MKKSHIPPQDHIAYDKPYFIKNTNEMFTLEPESCLHLLHFEFSPIADEKKERISDGLEQELGQLYNSLDERCFSIRQQPILYRVCVLSLKRTLPHIVQRAINKFQS